MFYELAEDMTDEQHSKELFQYVVQHTGYSEAVDIISGDSHYGNKGMEAMQEFAHLGSQRYVSNREEIGGLRSYGNALRNTVAKLPDPDAAAFLESQSQDCLMFGCPSDNDIMRQIEIHLVAEEEFDADMSTEIIDLARELSESMTKLDLLEEREAISGGEWYDRHERLEA